MYKISKRIFDLLIVILLFPFFILLYLVVALAIKLDDRGPIIYNSKRIGLNEKIFNMYKFRSMKVNAPVILNTDGSSYNSKNDNRVTRVGKILRETSIDEIPQIMNVLFGDMSIIGPRASGIESLNSFQEDEKDKMNVRPGITGYTQANFRNGISVREKRLKDAWYANNMSFTLDFRILCKTIITVFKRNNLYTN